MSRRTPPTAPPSTPTQDDVAAALSTLLRALSARSEAANDDGRPEPLMTPEEAAQWARVSVDTLERWRPLGLRSYGGGRVRRYRGSDILAFLARLERDEDDLDDVSERARRAARQIREASSGIHP